MTPEPGLNTTPQPGLLSVVIPNWNGAHFLTTCLDALAAQDYPHLEIILADNASTDGSQALAEQHPAPVHLVQLAENKGFTGACNAGMQAAQGEFIALLNNDTEVAPTWATAVIGAFGHGQRIGSIASKMLLFDQRDHLHTAGDLYTVAGQAVNRGVWQADTGQYDKVEDVFSACGGSAVYRRDMLDDIGLLDDDFFFSGEDVDLGWRAQLRGWRCLYTPDAIVYHHLSATGGGVTSSYYDGRNSIFILIKNIPASIWRKYGVKILLYQAQQAWAALRAWRGEAARARLRGMVAGLQALPRLLRKRRIIQQRRIADDRTIENRLSPPMKQPVEKNP